MRWLAATGLATCLILAHAEEVPDAYLLVQVSFVAGFQHHEGKKLFSRLKVGDSLQLVRELGNAHDPDAIRVEWRHHTLGYVPQNANENLARQLDFGNRLRARITRLSRHRDPDRRVEMEIFLPL